MKKYQRCVLCPEIELTWFVHIYKTLHPITILVTIEAPKIPSMRKATSKLVSSRREHGDRGGRAIVARRISQTRPGGCFCVRFRHCTLHQAVVRIGTYSEDWRHQTDGFLVYLAGWWLSPTPLLKYEFASWGYDIPNMMGKSYKSHVPNHQPLSTDER